MESTLPALAFVALVVAQFAAVVAVQIYFPNGFLPPSPLRSAAWHIPSLN